MLEERPVTVLPASCPHCESISLAVLEHGADAFAVTGWDHHGLPVISHDCFYADTFSRELVCRDCGGFIAYVPSPPEEENDASLPD